MPSRFSRRFLGGFWGIRLFNSGSRILLRAFMPRFPLELPLQTPQWLLRNQRGILLLILSLGCLVQIIVTLFTNGGGDLQYAYVPTVMSILKGQDLYLSGRPWTTGYRPFFFLLMGGMAWLGCLVGSLTLATRFCAVRIGVG